MKKTTIYLFLIWISFNSYAQNPDDYHYSNGWKAINLAKENFALLEKIDTTNEEDKSRLEELENLIITDIEKSRKEFVTIIEKHPDSQHYMEALRQARNLSNDLNELNKTLYFNDLILKLGDNTPQYRRPSMLKREACFSSAVIYFEEKEYEKCLSFLETIKKYPYRNYPTPNSQKQSLDCVLMTANSFYYLDNKAEALKVLLPSVFLKHITESNEIIDLSFKILLEENSPEEILKKLKLSCESPYGKPHIHPQALGLNELHIEFYGAEIRFRNSFVNIEEIDLEKFKTRIFNSFFAKELTRMAEKE